MEHDLDFTGKLVGDLVDVASVLGHEDAMVVAARLGGTRVSIPMHYRPECKLAVQVGEPIAKKLIEFFRGDRLVIPMMSARVSRERRERIVELRDGGMAIAEIARTMGCTEGNVYYHLQRAGRVAADPRQVVLPFE